MDQSTHPSIYYTSLYCISDVRFLNMRNKQTNKQNQFYVTSVNGVSE